MTYCNAAQDLLSSFYAQELVKMEKKDCIERFFKTDQLAGLVTTPSPNDFLAVTSESRNSTVLEAWFLDRPAWLCLYDVGPEFNGPTANSSADLWEECMQSIYSLNTSTTFEVGLAKVPVDYCLVAPPSNPGSELQCSLVIMLVVISCNIIKLVCCLLAARRMATRQPLVTIGDAVTSFLETPDPTTARLCLFNKYSAAVKTSPAVKSEPSRWTKRATNYRWFQVPQTWIWYAAITLYVVTLSYCDLYLQY
jgi:hypothetical protein